MLNRLPYLKRMKGATEHFGGGFNNYVTHRTESDLPPPVLPPLVLGRGLRDFINMTSASLNRVCCQLSLLLGKNNSLHLVSRSIYANLQQLSRALQMISPPFKDQLSPFMSFQERIQGEVNKNNLNVQKLYCIIELPRLMRLLSFAGMDINQDQMVNFLITCEILFHDKVYGSYTEYGWMLGIVNKAFQLRVRSSNLLQMALSNKISTSSLSQSDIPKYLLKKIDQKKQQSPLKRKIKQQSQNNLPTKTQITKQDEQEQTHGQYLEKSTLISREFLFNMQEDKQMLSTFQVQEVIPKWNDGQVILDIRYSSSYVHSNIFKLKILWLKKQLISIFPNFIIMEQVVDEHDHIEQYLFEVNICHNNIILQVLIYGVGPIGRRIAQDYYPLYSRKQLPNFLEIFKREVELVYENISLLSWLYGGTTQMAEAQSIQPRVRKMTNYAYKYIR